jgi:hypothetical protein
VDPGGELRLTVQFERPRWQRVLGAGSKCDRTFVLDSLGREVYEQCGSGRTVRELIKAFAGAHHVSQGEAEYSVTTYLRTLMRKGLIEMEVQRGKTP